MATIRYIVNDTEMDAAQVAWPSHISQRESGLGYGDRVWILQSGGSEINSGVNAVRAVYPYCQVTANRHQAAALAGQIYD